MISNLGTSIVWSHDPPTVPLPENLGPWKSVGRITFPFGIAYFQGLLPKTNMSSENQWLEDVFPIEIVPFLGDIRSFSVVQPFVSGRAYPPWSPHPSKHRLRHAAVCFQGIFEGADGTHLFHWWGLKACLIWETSRWYTRNGWYADSCKKTMSEWIVVKSIPNFCEPTRKLGAW